MTNPTCPDCGSAMEEGFLPDMSYGGHIEGHWHRGRAEPYLFLGLFKRTQPKLDNNKLLTIESFRCTKCGLLKSYAREQHDKSTSPAHVLPPHENSFPSRLAVGPWRREADLPEGPRP